MPRALARFLSLGALVVFSASVSGLAEAAAHAEHNSWTKCRHTGERIARGNPCRCGCNKAKRKPMLKFIDTHSNCDGDDVVAHVPQFTKLVAHWGQGNFIWLQTVVVFLSLQAPLWRAQDNFVLLKPG